MNLRPTRWRGWMVLCLLFALSVPLVTPYLRGDGVGYYAWLRSAVMDHDLQFANEYRHGDPVVRRNVFDEQGHVRRPWKTGAGHVANDIDRIFLYRRPILDYWCESGEDLPHIVRHVLIHEIGHHFGLSDDDMEAIEAKAEEESRRVQPGA